MPCSLIHQARCRLPQQGWSRQILPQRSHDGLSLLQIRTLLPASPTKKREKGRHLMHKRYWLDYDPVALAVLVIGIGMIELLALSI